MKLLHSEYLFLLPVILAVVFFLIKKQFVQVRILPETMKLKKKMRLFVLISRLIVFTLLIVAVAGPFEETRTKIQGNLKLTILIDNSTSMDIFDKTPIQPLIDEVKKELPIQVKLIAQGIRSALGDAVLGVIEQDSNILLISDGNANEGISLGDLGLFALSMNASISNLVLNSVKTDVGVAVFGPGKTVTDAENNFLIKVSHFGTTDYKLSVSIDDAPLPEEEAQLAKGEHADELIIKRKFENGYHRITAQVSVENDYFPKNNQFHKTIHVVDKPPVLFVTQKPDPLVKVLGELYDVTQTDIIPRDVEKYYTIIINDVPAEDVRNLESITEFIIDGNGLVAIGGEHSFDAGNYKNSLLESILPVTIGKGERKRGNSNIVAVIDISGTAGETYELVNGKLVQTTGREEQGLSLSKALAISVLESLSQSNKVGAVAFATEAFKVEDIIPLYQHRKALVEKIGRLKGSGQSYFHVGLMGANELLKNVQGDKNIILFTDGQTFNDGIKQQTKDIAAALATRGTKVYVVGVGTHVDEDFLKKVAEEGNGIYFRATEANKFKVLFGDVEERQSTGPTGLVLLNTNHFITKDLDIDAIVEATNQVIPKTNAQLLVTNDGGEPVVTVWRYGLGRVTALTGFSGDNLGELLTKRNSRLLTRIFNWNIGDPERKKDYVVSIEDTRINIPGKVLVKSRKVPIFKGMEFTKLDKLLYQSSFIQEKPGFHSLLEAVYAANYEREYQELGINPELSKIVALSGGKLFKPTDAKQIVQYIKTNSYRERVEKKDLKKNFLLLAMLLFLIEIALRRFKENEML